MMIALRPAYGGGDAFAVSHAEIERRESFGSRLFFGGRNTERRLISGYKPNSSLVLSPPKWQQLEVCAEY
jgi:hypothetical protein